MSETEIPPTPDGVPLLGNSWAFSRNPVEAMETWAREGDIVRLKMPSQSMYMVTGPPMIKEILVEKQEKFSIGPAQRETFSGIEDHAVTTTTGERWKRLRKALAPAFTRDAIDRYADRMASATASYVDEWEDGEQFDLFSGMRMLTVNILGETLLDTDIRGNEAVVMDAADALVDRANFRRPGQLLPGWIPTPTDRRFERAVRVLDEYVDALIAERRGTESGRDVCSVLLTAHREDELTLGEVRHNLVAMLLAGHDSPAVALTYTWYLLSDHPVVYDSLVEEYESTVNGNRPDGNDFEELERTRNVVSESLRLYPPTMGINRQTTESVTVGEYELPAGTQVLIPQWVTHRDERFWDDPTTFDPSRWHDPSDRPDYAYFPFGGGPRNCIGMHFAQRELTLALTTMVGRLDIDVEPAGPLTFTPSIQLRPDTELKASVRRR